MSIHDLRFMIYDFKRRTRLNAKAPEHGVIFAPGVELRLNADGALPEWIQLAPFGSHPTRDKSAVQVFNSEAAQQVISWFNFFPRRIARLANLNAIKVWVGHPDFAPTEWPERIDLGSVVELNADEHGLNGRVRWNAGALDHVKKHKFPSVAWDCDVHGDGTETPAMLWSVGMWHKPNIKTVQPVINCLCESGDDPEKETQIEPEEPMLKSIMSALISAGIVKENDDENAVVGAIGSLIQSLAWKRDEQAREAQRVAQVRTALNAIADVSTVPDEALTGETLTRLNAVIAERDAHAAEVARLNAQVETERTARVNAVIAHVIETGRATKADEETLRNQLNGAPDTAVEALLARPVQLNCKGLSIGGSKPALMEASERATRLNAWLSEYQDKHGCDYAAAWAASEADEKMKAVHEAMRAADKARAAGGGDA